MKRGLGRGQVRRSRKRQVGAEMVEFALTLFLWFTVFVLVIDMAIGTYDKGAVINAARDAARQGSLYWVDPSNYSDTTPIDNKRIKTSMITTAVEYWDGTVIGANSIAATIDVNGPYVPRKIGSSWIRAANATVDVVISFPPSFLFLANFLGTPGWSLTAQVALSTEARL